MGAIEIQQDPQLQVREVIGILQSSPVMEDGVRSALYKAYSGRVWERVFAEGLTYGEASGAPGTAMATRDDAEFRVRLRAIDNDLDAQIGIVRDGVLHYFKNGEFPPPYYAWRVAIILRSQRRFQLEADFLRAFCRHFSGGPGKRYQDLFSRIPKAQALADKVVRRA